MDKKKIISKVYKVLKIYEDESFENYYSYLGNLVKELNGEENEILNPYTKMLRGLWKYEDDIVHNEVRSVVLHITNGIDRKL